MMTKPAKPYRVECADCLKFLPTLPDNSIDAIVTDPPYELGFMGKAWDKTGIAYNVNVWKECLRVLKPGGYLIAFGGSRTYHRLACAVEDAGFIVRDQLLWVYGEGFPKSHDIGKAIDAEVKLGGSSPKKRRMAAMGDAYIPGETVGSCGKQRAMERNPAKPIEKSKSQTDVSKTWDGWGTALKPAHEPMVLAQKPISERTIAKNVLKWGVGALNIDACRIKTTDQWTYNADKNGTTFHGQQGARIKQSSGKKGSQLIQSNPGGRWPANLMHDGSADVLQVFPRAKGASSVSRSGKPQKNAYGLRGKQEIAPSYNDDGSAARFFYCVKTKSADRSEGVAENNHPTVKPTELMRHLLRLVTPPNGLVLDPFTGSGSTGKACMLESFRFVGSELSKEYVEIALARIKFGAKQNKPRPTLPFGDAE